MRFFFSEKDTLRRGGLPLGFSDFFPVGALDERGVFLASDRPSAGLILSIKGDSPERFAVVCEQIGGWLRTSDLLNSDTCISASIFRKTYPASEDKTANDRSVILRLRTEMILSLCVSVERPDLTASLGRTPGSARRLLAKLTGEFEEMTARAIEVLGTATEELCSHLRGQGLVARRVENAARAASLARFFWTAERGYVHVSDERASSDAVSSFIGEGLSFGSTRTFWIDGTSLRMAFSLRAPGPVRTQTGVEAPNDATKTIRDPSVLPAVCRLSDQSIVGTQIVTLSLGGSLACREETRTLGYFGDDLASRVKSEVEAGSRLHSETRKERKMRLASLKRRPWGRGPLRANATFLSSTPITEHLWARVGTMGEQTALSELERSIIQMLATASDGGDWQLVDATWVEVLYTLFPGIARLDGRGVASAVGTFFIS